MAKPPKPEPPKNRNPLARIINHIPQQVIPNKKKNRKPKHKQKLDQTIDWAFAFIFSSLLATLIPVPTFSRPWA